MTRPSWPALVPPGPTTTPFDPSQLTANASLNHVVLGPAGGPGLRGRLAEEVCSRDALLALATGLELAGLRHDHLADDLAAAMGDPDDHRARAAAATLRRFGRRLGTLVATLRDPATAHQQAATRARHGFLAHWLTLDSVWLAGGLLAGACRAPILDGLLDIAALAPEPCRVDVLPDPEHAALTGAAQHRLDRHPQDNAVGVVDLGHTHIKLTLAQRVPGRPPVLHPISRHPAPTVRSAPAVEEAVASALATVARRIGAPAAIVASVAAFLDRGQPIDDGVGLYGVLNGRTGALRQRVEADTNLSIQLELVHDGTAAAAAAPANSATITVGTWLGVGFNPAREAHR